MDDEWPTPDRPSRDTTHAPPAIDERPLPSNWGRWGDDDEHGTLNLITDAVRARAAAEVRTGQSVSLALPITPTPLLSGPHAPAQGEASPVQLIAAHAGSPSVAGIDLMLVTNHHPRSTHLDALSHVVVGGDRVYPGRAFAETVTPAGTRAGSTTSFAAGIVTRGVFLDLAVDEPLPPGHRIVSADLDAAERRTGDAVEPGDALVLRTGWRVVVDPHRPLPGLTVDAMHWLHARDVSVFVSDVGDAIPPFDPALPNPVHQVGVGRLGLALVDAAELDALAAMCAVRGRSTFLLSLAPPRILGMTGVPVNPVAIF